MVSVVAPVAVIVIVIAIVIVIVILIVIVNKFLIALVGHHVCLTLVSVNTPIRRTRSLLRTPLHWLSALLPNPLSSHSH